MEPAPATNPLFGFTGFKVPPEATGKYRTVANLMLAVGWIALVGGGLALASGLLGLLLLGSFPFPELVDGFGTLARVLAVIQVVIAVGAAVWLMMAATTAIASWMAKDEDALEQAKQLGTWALIGGAVVLILGNSFLMGAALAGVGIALMVLAGDTEVQAALESS